MVYVPTLYYIHLYIHNIHVYCICTHEYSYIHDIVVSYDDHLYNVRSTEETTSILCKKSDYMHVLYINILHNISYSQCKYVDSVIRFRRRTKQGPGWQRSFEKSSYTSSCGTIIAPIRRFFLRFTLNLIRYKNTKRVKIKCIQ